MPDYDSRRADPFPYPTAAEIENAPGDRAIKAARNIVTRRVHGIPRKSFLLGESDRAPVLQGVADFTAAVYDLIDKIPAADLNGSLREKAHYLESMMADTGAPLDMPDAAAPCA